MRGNWVIDTDMFFHRVAPDSNVSAAAKKICQDNSPIAISEFTKVELKGNRIRYLCLLRRKIDSSGTYNDAVAKIQNSGGGPSIRQVIGLFVEFLMLIGRADKKPEPWNELKGLLLTHIDSEIFVTWNSLTSDVDKVINEFNCTRAAEQPAVINGQWSITIPNCTKSNTTCTISDYMKNKLTTLKNLEAHLSNLPPSRITKELSNILEVLRETIRTGEFPWQGTTCRRVGDLLIGLQAKSEGGLITANQREHSELHGPVGYHLKLFPLAQIRQK